MVSVEIVSIKMIIKGVPLDPKKIIRGFFEKVGSRQWVKVSVKV